MNRVVAACVFLLILTVHFAWTTRPAPAGKPGGPWAAYALDAPAESRLSRYAGTGDYWLGLSYASAGAFACVCLARLIRLRREALASSASGLALSGVLWGAVCFFTGCCGSPMLPIYLGLFGSRFGNVTRPLTFLITALSILGGYAWMLKRAPKAIAKDVHARLHEVA